jgi:hypothetical protein
MMPNKDLIKSRKQFVGQKRKAARSNESVAAAKMALGQPSKKGPSDAALRKKFLARRLTARSWLLVMSRARLSVASFMLAA